MYYNRKNGKRLQKKFQRKKTFSLIKNMLSEIKISTEGREHISEEISQKIQLKDRDGKLE